MEASMLLDITKSVALPQSADQVWALLREPERVAGCLPNVQEFAAGPEPGRYTTLLVERLGPFSVRVALAIGVSEEAADPAARRMIATVSGEDKAGQARVRGDVTATVRPDEGGGDGSVLDVVSSVEVLGRMAALGAVPMRRRGDQVFEQFIRNIGAALEAEHG
jgi:carbon monoxide dehydrogenase subunit G